MKNFFTSFFETLADPKSYYSFQKEMQSKSIEQTFFNTLSGKFSFRAVVLPQDVDGPDALNSQSGGSKAIRVRPENLHSFILPEPCSVSGDLRKKIISMHPIAYPDTTFPVAGGNIEQAVAVSTGMVVECTFTQGPQGGKLRGLVYRKTNSYSTSLNLSCFGDYKTKLKENFESGQLPLGSAPSGRQINNSYTPIYMPKEANRKWGHSKGFRFKTTDQMNKARQFLDQLAALMEGTGIPVYANSAYRSPYDQVIVVANNTIRENGKNLVVYGDKTKELYLKYSIDAKRDKNSQAFAILLDHEEKGLARRIKRAEKKGGSYQGHGTGDSFDLSIRTILGNASKLSLYKKKIESLGAKVLHEKNPPHFHIWLGSWSPSVTEEQAQSPKELAAKNKEKQDI